MTHCSKNNTHQNNKIETGRENTVFKFENIYQLNSDNSNLKLKLNNNLNLKLNNSIKINIIGDSIAEGIKLNWKLQPNSCIASVKFYTLSGSTIRYWKSKQFQYSDLSFISLGTNDFKGNNFNSDDANNFLHKFSLPVIWIPPSSKSNFKNIEIYKKFLAFQFTLPVFEYPTLDGIHYSGHFYKKIGYDIQQYACNIALLVGKLELVRTGISFIGIVVSPAKRE